MTASYPYTYLPVARFQTAKEARAHWLTLTLNGQDAKVTRHA